LKPARQKSKNTEQPQNQSANAVHGKAKRNGNQQRGKEFQVVFVVVHKSLDTGERLNWMPLASK